MLQSKAGYIDARPLTTRSTKTSCNARPDHTSGSECEILYASRCFPLRLQTQTFLDAGGTSHLCQELHRPRARGITAEHSLRDPARPIIRLAAALWLAATGASAPACASWRQSAVALTSWAAGSAPKPWQGHGPFVP